MIKRLTLLLVPTLVAALNSCAGPGVINAYDGPARGDRDVAVLYTPDIPYTDEKGPGKLSAIDGKPYGTYLDGYPSMTRALPGAAMLKINCYIPSFRQSVFRLVNVTLKPGHYYELVCERLSAACIDRGTDYNAVRDALPEAARGKSP
jgi:hypothetical protein